MEIDGVFFSRNLAPLQISLHRALFSAIIRSSAKIWTWSMFMKVESLQLGQNLDF